MGEQSLGQTLGVLSGTSHTGNQRILKAAFLTEAPFEDSPPIANLHQVQAVWKEYDTRFQTVMAYDPVYEFDPLQTSMRKFWFSHRRVMREYLQYQSDEAIAISSGMILRDILSFSLAEASHLLCEHDDGQSVFTLEDSQGVLNVFSWEQVGF